MKVTAAVTHEQGKLSIETVELEAPKASEVLVKIVAAGVCHTDSAGINQIIPVTLPAIFGHEGVGIVEEVGVGVDTLKPVIRLSSVILPAAAAKTAQTAIHTHVKT